MWIQFPRKSIGLEKHPLLAPESISKRRLHFRNLPMPASQPIVDRVIAERANKVWRLLYLQFGLVCAVAMFPFEKNCGGSVLSVAGSQIPALAEAAKYSLDPCFFRRVGVASLLISIMLSGAGFYWLLQHRSLRYRNVRQKAQALCISGLFLSVSWGGLLLTTGGPYSLSDGRSAALLYVATSSYIAAVPFLAVCYGGLQLACLMGLILAVLAPVEKTNSLGDYRDV